MRRNFWAVGILTAGLALSICGCQKQKTLVTEGAGTDAVEISAESGIETGGAEPNGTGENHAGPENRSGSKPEDMLTEPPEIGLTDALSSTLSSFTITSGNYTWNCKSDRESAEEEMENVVACGSHPLEVNEEKAEKLYVPDYNQMEGAAYAISCPVMPDQILLTGWNRMALGNMESPAQETVTYEDTYLIELEPGMVYELTAVWEEDKLEDRGFFGEASYVFLTDGNSDGEERSGQSETMVMKGGEKTGNPENMALYSSYPFTYGEKEWELQKFVQEDMLMDGELAMDDRCRFLIRAVSDECSYLLFDEAVQLGVPAADVWIDTNEKLHIVLRDVRTARYRIIDFVYSQEKGEFLGEKVMDGDGINYLGTTEK